MQACYLTITTTADGVETKVSKTAEMDLEIQSAKLRYQDEGALVNLSVQGECVTIERQGDYTLFLPLTRGETTVGKLGIGGSCGELRLYTHKVQYTITEESLLLLLRYDMLMGEETQEMSLRLLAKLKKGEKL